MRSVFIQILAITFLSVCYLQQVGENQRLKSHIQYLEEYIQENDLPTPAFRINTDRFNFEIGK